jgi:hypothetical protein
MVYNYICVEKRKCRETLGREIADGASDRALLLFRFLSIRREPRVRSLIGALRDKDFSL